MLCASACATIWLGGTRRFVDPTAKIGFHAAYIERSGQIRETGTGNALLGSYLNQLGLSDRAILYITSAAPQSMQWLTAEDAQALGIDLEILAPPSATPAVAAPTAPPAPSSLPKGLAEQTAERISDIMAIWSDPNQHVVTVLSLLFLYYAQQVDYYGKTTSRQAVVTDKKRFMERWPQRNYTIRRHTLKTTCNTARVCVANGWRLP